MEIFQIVVLSLSALLLIYAGLNRLVTPIKSFCLKAYSESEGNQLASKADMFNEMRGAGSNLAISGMLIGIGAALPELRIVSLIVAILVFIGFALGRLLSLGLDGKPNKDLLQGLWAEIILGTLNGVCLLLVYV